MYLRATQQYITIYSLGTAFAVRVCICSKRLFLLYTTKTMADDLYAPCAEILSVCQGFKDDLATVLDPEAGFAPRMRNLCEHQ